MIEQGQRRRWLEIQPLFYCLELPNSFYPRSEYDKVVKRFYNLILVFSDR